MLMITLYAEQKPDFLKNAISSFLWSQVAQGSLQSKLVISCPPLRSYAPLSSVFNCFISLILDNLKCMAGRICVFALSCHMFYKEK